MDNTIDSTILQSDRLLLRRWKESDASEIFPLCADPELGPRAGWPPHQSVQESLDAIRTFFFNNGTWAIVLKSSGTIVGCVGYQNPDKSNIPISEQEGEVVYWVGRPYWNQGICSEALGLVVDHCRSIGMRCLWGDHFDDNPASGRVMAKCGFLPTGQHTTCPNLLVGSEKSLTVMRLELI